jgi:hypothetical protein
MKREVKEKRTVFSTSGTGIIKYLYAKKINLNLNDTPCTNINSKWITELNVKFKIIKLRKKHNGKFL